MSSRTATKPADDQPIDFNLDTVEAEVALTPFRVHWAGRRWTLQHSEELDIWGLADGAARGDVAATIAIFRLALGPKQWAEFSKKPMPQYKLKALFEAYRKHCGLGESEASPSS
ncbi:hypothetical protein [Streptomyces longwoodensis]|uniref:hypothetical protein n=1 Tax=Streptomyces longwoodensis TaxID=68231 RepID=UPI00224C93FC|nr:hypothetical protein [Streptomyces longwoodensis]MCX4993855.1 hypothetical protein [Streptomyces longwoodensis]MCX4998025.1 hypothetical protein [Streptomyces longwoodensis]